MKHLTVIGGGLAGTEAAWQAAERGVRVTLVEMRPNTMTAAHHTGDLAELVCSNSLGSDVLHRAQGILKHELRRLHSFVLEVADQHRVPAGSALAVDRRQKSRYALRGNGRWPRWLNHSRKEGIAGNRYNADG